MKSKISELMDGELDTVSADEIITELKKKNDLLSDWETYHMISEALRQSTISLSIDVARRVSDQLVSEPILFTPRASQLHKRKLIALSAAASFAALVSGWLIMQTTGVQQEVLIAEKINSNTIVQVDHPNVFQPSSVLLPFVPQHVGDYSLTHRGFLPNTMMHVPVTGVYKVEEKEEKSR